MTKEEIKQINDTTWVRKTTILSSFFIGWALTIGGFLAPPLGVIDNSIIIILGESLTYVGAALGLKEYADRSILLLKRNIDKDGNRNLENSEENNQEPV